MNTISGTISSTISVETFNHQYIPYVHDRNNGVKGTVSYKMVSWVFGLLFLCVCGPNLRHSEAIPIEKEDDRNGRSYKRELKLFVNDVQDSWVLDDDEYMSRRELQEQNDAVKRNKIYGTNKDAEDKKRWLNVDAQKNALKQSLSPEYEDELPKDGDLFQEDIVMDTYVRETFNGEATKRDAVSVNKYYWTGGNVHYVFDEDIDPISREQILRAIDQYHKYTCIKLIPRNGNELVDDYINFISNGSSCYSNVGRQGGRQNVSIGSGCYRIGTPIHEIMHVLGFFHEMARPDRDETVEIHWENIKPGLKHNFRKIPKDLDLQLIDYNLNSVLQYSNLAFSNNGEDTITDILDPGRGFGQRCGFSVGDIIEINKLYHCPQFNLRHHLNKRRIDTVLCDKRSFEF